jgi:hypothetical protein
MNRLSDEMLNKFIDDELSFAEVKKIMKIINESESNRERYLILLKIHQSLKNLEEDNPSLLFTSHLIDKIKVTYGARKKDKYFVLSVTSIFVLIILGLVVYVFDIAANNASLLHGESSLINNFVNYAHSFSMNLVDIFSKSNFSIIGTVISILMLGIAYVFYENLRNVKQRLGKTGN